MSTYKIQSKKHQNLILACVSMGTFISAIDAGIVNIILPTLSRYFDASPSAVARVTIIYLVVTSAILVTVGKIADLKGYRKIILWGFIIFVGGSLLCGFSPSLNFLIFFRVIQAIGGAIIKAVGIAIISAYLPDEEQGTFIGTYLSVSAMGITLGPIIGGILTSYLSWHWIFFINIPFGLAGFTLGWKYIPKQKPAAGENKLDLIGSAIFFMFMSGSIFILNTGRELGWFSPIIISSAIISLILIIVFYFYENSIEEPLIDFKLFKDLNFTLGNATSSLMYMVFSGAMVLFPFYLENIRNLDVKISGILMTASPFAGILVSRLSGKLSDKIGTKKLCITGIVTGMITLLLISTTLDAGSIYPYILLIFILDGISMSLFVPPNSSLIMSAVPVNKKGMVSSLMTCLRNLGIIYGICIFETVFSESLPHNISVKGLGLHKGLVPVETMLTGFRNAFYVGLILCVLVLFLLFFVREREEESIGEK